jgi:anionic cell wall polymer biosynthesis LytR-Cps2A-Psr (LCP) family protein
MKKIYTKIATFYNNNRRQSVIVAAVVLFLTASVASYAAFSASRQTVQVIATPKPTPSILDDRAIPESTDLTIPTPTTIKDFATSPTINVLLLGYGGAGHQGGFLTDVVILAHLDIKQKKLAFIHIPRDTWVSLPTSSGNTYTKINAALPMGLRVGNYPKEDLAKDTLIKGSYLTRHAVKQVTGFDTDLVVAIDFDRFMGVINALRGIDVQVTQTLDDHWYPVKGLELELCGHTPEEVTHMSNTMSGFNLEKQFPCRYERVLVEPGVVQMDGDLALKYVRSRHSSSDFDRGRRQMEVLAAVFKKLMSLKALDNIDEFYGTLGKAVKTDITKEVITTIAPRLVQLPSYSIKSIGLSTANVLSSTTTSSGASALLPKAGQDNFAGVISYIAGQMQ